MTKRSISRRDVLKIAGVTAAAAAGLKVVTHSDASEPAPGSDGRQWTMVIDQNKCIGCGYCIMACRAHNDVSPDITWNPLYEVGKVGGKQGLPAAALHAVRQSALRGSLSRAGFLLPIRRHRDDGL